MRCYGKIFCWSALNILVFITEWSLHLLYLVRWLQFCVLSFSFYFKRKFVMIFFFTENTVLRFLLFANDCFLKFIHLVHCISQPSVNVPTVVCTLMPAYTLYVLDIFVLKYIKWNFCSKAFYLFLFLRCCVYCF